VLVVSPPQVLKTFALYFVVAVIHFIFRKKFFAISFEPLVASAAGVSVRWWDFLFYVLFGIVVTSFVQIGGVLLVFSYLIVPAVCATFLVESLRAKLAVGWVVATVASVAGLYGSFRLDLPTGAAIVCSLGGALILTLVATRFRRRA
jgi:ABC-type Mn2+/Zn2+ transport system permease subunit